MHRCAPVPLAGTIPMPPRWALGFHQCRFSYEPAERVKQVCACALGPCSTGASPHAP